MVKRRKMDPVWLPIFIALATVAVLAGGGWFDRNTPRYSVESGKLERKVAETLQSDRGETQTELKNAEQKIQLALKTAERAVAERDAMEAQLKQAEGKAQLAQLVQQSENLAPSERTILETELKQAEDKVQLLQLVQQSEYLAPSERSALEAQLKQIEGKAQSAQQNADLVTAERDTLQLQLKKAEEELNLAKKNRDAGAAQFIAEEEGPPKRESIKARGYLHANQTRAGRIKRKLTQPPGAAERVLMALERRERAIQKRSAGSAPR